MAAPRSFRGDLSHLADFSVFRCHGGDVLNCARIIDRKTMRARNRCFSLRHRRAFGEESGRRRQGEHDSCVFRRTKEDRGCVCVGEFCVCVLNTVSEYNCVAFNSKGILAFSPAFFSKISLVTAHVSLFSNPNSIQTRVIRYVSRTQYCIIRPALFFLFFFLLLFLLLLLLLPRKKNRRPLHGR